MTPNTNVIAAAYAEIALKGRNRKAFQRRLLNNIRVALKGQGVTAIDHVESRILIYLDDPAGYERVAAALRDVFGLQWVSPAVSVPRDEVVAELTEDLAAGREPRLSRLGEIACSLTAADRGEAVNFKVVTRRSDDTFPLKSPEISRIVGAAVHHDSGLPGRMSRPDFTVNVLVMKDNVLIFTGKETAWGGLPAGTGGRVMVLFSGGIDSPVAAWLMMRRGCRPEFIHFYSGRTPAEADTAKIEELVRILARYSPVPLNLHLVPAVPYELQAIGAIPDSYDMILFRRYMVKTAVRMAYKTHCPALVTGDSLGQVASQTLKNLQAISPDIELPILRPLVGMDKMEITAWSRKIGVYATSILPYRDCCSIRSPRPVLSSRPQDVLRFSQRMGLDEAVAEAINQSVKVVVTR